MRVIMNGLPFDTISPSYFQLANIFNDTNIKEAIVGVGFTNGKWYIYYKDEYQEISTPYRSREECFELLANCFGVDLFNNVS